MHDYQLERLNTRSFEQLVQALSLAVLGPQVVIFGDGPDGGREASFDGPVKYPEGAAAWNGTGIVQAKFRQKPDSSPKKNADWVIEQLKAEFDKLQPRPKRAGTRQRAAPGERICPEYYLLATNVALSATAKTGGKDRVAALFEVICKSHGLRGWAVWDGDRIARFLDGHTDIRTAYAPFVLPGDVLSLVIERLAIQTPDFATTMRLYLERQLRDDQYARLSQGGYTDAHTVPLSNVFVDLPVSTGQGLVLDDERPTFLQVLFDEGRQVLRGSVLAQRPRGRHGEDVAPGRLVLVGGPGQGKTTVGQFACQLLRARLLRATGARFSVEVEQALLAIERNAGGLADPGVLRYPLRVDLKELAEALTRGAKDGCTSLLDFLARAIGLRTDANPGTDDLRRWLKAYPWLLVLDGLDEVPASSNREPLLGAIRDFIASEAHGLDADMLVLATTRPQGYADEFDPQHYRHLQLLPLTPEEALHYGTQLAKARHPGGGTRVEELTATLKLASTGQATARLMESPLQTTIMLQLIEAGGVPPEHRWKLFHDYYEVIYRREKERRTSFSPLLQKMEPDFHWIHHRAGWLLQQRNAQAGNTDARLSHEEFEALVDARLQARDHKARERKALVEQIRTAATDRLVLLVGNTAQEIGFEIRSLQEFMAAEHCFDGGERVVRQAIHRIAQHGYWRNVFLFIAGRVFFREEPLVDTLLAACDRLDDAESDPALGLLRAGAQLALAMLEDGAASNQPGNLRALARKAAGLLEQADGDATAGLAPHFGRTTSGVLKEALGRRLAAGDADLGAWRLGVALAAGGPAAGWAREQMAKAFPWEHQDADALLRACCSLISLRRGTMHLISLRPQSVPIDALFEWGLVTYSYDPESMPPGLREIAAAVREGPGNCMCQIVSADHVPQPCTGSKLQTGVFESWARQMLDAPESAPIHPHWQVLRLAHAFAARPSPSRLSALIKRALTEPPGTLPLWLLPWQLAAADEARQNGTSVAEILRKLETGALGRPADWLRWEQREQLRLDQLGYPDGLLSASDEGLGALMRYGPHADFTRASERQAVQFARELAEAVPRLAPKSAVAQFLTGGTLSELPPSQPGEGASPEIESCLEGLISACVAAGVPMPAPVLARILTLSLAPAKRLQLLLDVAACVRPDHPYHIGWGEGFALDYGAHVAPLLGPASETGRVAALVEALSCIPLPLLPVRAPAMFTGLCDLVAAEHPQATALLALSRLDWPPQDASVLAEALRREVDRGRTTMAHELDKHIEQHGAAGPHLEALLMDLISADTGRLPFEARSSLARTLSFVVRRRPAPFDLPDPKLRVGALPIDPDD